MTEVEAQLLAIVRQFNDAGLPIRGRKALQKLLYLLQARSGVGVFDYRLHLFGPYADTVATALDALEDQGLIRVDEERQISVTPYGRAEEGTLPPVQIDAISEIVDAFVDDDPMSLELIATVLFMWQSELRLYRKAADYQVVRKVLRYKGAKFTTDEVHAALERLKTLGFARAG